jgi:hypothetical protein
MSYFLRPVWGYPSEVWRIEDKGAGRIDVATFPGWPTFIPKEGETIWGALRRCCGPWWEPDGRCPFAPMMLHPGVYHPRMPRLIEPELDPIELHCPDPADRNPFALGTAEAIAEGQAQLAGLLDRLLDRLDRICRTVYPADRQLDTYGANIRELLILACTRPRRTGTACWTPTATPGNASRPTITARCAGR